ncbi:hemagglutinin repeat-containing protein [uncultured Rheinheimera sp.]|uniref:hemagglutinin repeat-containing protein n=1 Tax=uncultured Rheinheimera sp. TaxID=400532 RepID=UPI002592A285|nr:hemagglutinin repeat-containing protein [uncultured Rheinheimera sp.]
MVTHQAAEVANAAKAAEAAAEQLEDTRRNYKAWQQQQDSLTAQITKLESELAQGKPGVTQADIDEVRTKLDILKTDEAWHLANIAVAVDNAATATKALYQQGVATANSTTTLGFNAGLELNVNATQTKTQVQDSYSVGSVLSGSGVYLNTGNDGQLLVKGSAIDSSGAMALNVGSLVMQAGVNTHDSSTQTQQGNLNISQTVWGAAAGGPVVNASYNQSEQRDHSTTYTNASLTAADSLLLNVKNDATLIGATIHADKGLTATIGGNLTLESLQNLAYGSSKGSGVSAGVGYEGVAGNTTNTTALGKTGDAATANGGVSQSNSNYYTKETVLSSITSGGPLNMDVTGHTDITGALIASIDANGKDTGQLTLNTGSLSFTDLKNTH